jgi:hypothetical protein
MSILLKRYSLLDWNPEPEVRSRVRSRLRPEGGSAWEDGDERKRERPNLRGGRSRETTVMWVGNVER